MIIDWKTAGDSTKVCYCNDVTLDEIRKAIGDGARTLEDLQETIGACTGNRCEELNPKGVCCEADIEKILALYGGETSGGGCKCCKRGIS